MLRLTFHLSFIIIIQCVSFFWGAHAAIGLQAERIQVGPAMDIIQFNVHYWDEEDRTPSPCLGSTFCYVAVGWHYEGQAGILVENLVISAHENVTTVGEIARKYREKFGMPHSGTKTGITIGSRPREKICFAMKYQASGTPTMTLPGIMPGNSCQYIKPEKPILCYIHGPLDLNHGTVSSGEVIGNAITEKVKITCNIESDIRVKVVDKDIKMVSASGNGSLNSKIYLNGTDGEVILRANDIGVLLNVRSELFTSGSVKAGDYTGSTVMILEVI